MTTKDLFFRNLFAYIALLGFLFYFTIGKLEYIARKHKISEKSVLEYLKALHFPFNYIYVDLFYGLFQYENLRDKLRRLERMSDTWGIILMFVFGLLAGAIILTFLMDMIQARTLETLLLASTWVFLSLPAMWYARRFASELTKQS